MFTPPPVFDHEVERLAALRSYNVLDSLPEQAYDDIVALAAFICQVPIALITLVDQDRQWFKAKVGINVEETPREVSFCAHALGSDDLFLVPDTLADARFQNHPAVTDGLKLRYYAGMPLVSPAGYRLGTICVADQKPREVTVEQTQALAALSRQIVSQLELRRHRYIVDNLLVANRLTQAELVALNNILQSALEGIARVDDTGAFMSVNEGYSAAFGYTPEQMTGLPWIETIHPEDRQRGLETQNYIQTHRRAELEIRGQRKNGATCYLHLTLVSLRQEDGTTKGYYSFLRDMTENQKLQNHLARGAYHDALTDLPNRLFFEETLDHSLGRFARNSEQRFAVLYLDLDGFKQVNDELGHAAGDQVLREAARRITAAVRPGDVVARLGGDEFAVLLNDLHSLEDAYEVAERIRSSAAVPHSYEDRALALGVSIGLCPCCEGITDGRDMMRRADTAMYNAKKTGKNRIVIYDADTIAGDETLV